MVAAKLRALGDRLLVAIDPDGFGRPTVQARHRRVWSRTHGQNVGFEDTLLDPLVA